MTGGQPVHLPGGLLPSGRKVRAACLCGFATTPRVDERRALSALLSEHGHTEPCCAICGRDYTDAGPRRWRDVLDVLDDGRHGQFVACRDAPKVCRDGGAQRQVHLDRAAYESLDIEMPRPRFNVVR